MCKWEECALGIKTTLSKKYPTPSKHIIQMELVKQLERLQVMRLSYTLPPILAPGITDQEQKT